jgi:transposase
VATYGELTEVESGFRRLNDVMAMRPIFHKNEHRIKGLIFVAALALSVQRLLRKRLPEKKIDLSPARPIQVRSSVHFCRVPAGWTR